MPVTAGLARRRIAIAVGLLAAASLVPALLPGSAAARPGDTTAADQASGRWKVAKSGERSYRVTWTSPSPLPVTDARPEISVGGRWAGPATLSADGRRVSAVVSPAQRPTASDVDVLLGGQPLDATASLVPSADAAPPPPAHAVATDPGLRRPRPIVVRD